MPLIAALLVVVALIAAARDWADRAISQPPGVLAPAEPLQRDIEAPVFTLDRYRLRTRARFAVKARVLSGERYRLARGAHLMPRDLALGWGIMSDSNTLDSLSITQSDRWYYVKARGDRLPIPSEMITTNSANMHLIAANPTIARLIDHVRVGEIVEFEGMLVDVEMPNGALWRTSLSRTDTGAGACETVYVERFDIRH